MEDSKPVAKQNTKIKLLIAALAAACIGLMFLTNPNNLPLAFILAPFIVAWLLLLSLAFYLIDRYGPRFSKSSKQRFLAAFVMASFPIVCLVLQSIGQFSFKDFLTLVVLLAISLFYVGRLGKAA